MDLTIHTTFLPHEDAAASVAFYRDLLGFDVRNDVTHEEKRWITVGPVAQPEVSIVLEPAAADPSITEHERSVIAR